MATLMFLIGAGLGVGIVDPTAMQRMSAARLHPRRDPEGHPQGGDPADPPADPADPADPVDPPADPPADPPKETDWKAESRKHEARAKENAAAAKELAKLKQAQMSEAEKLAADRDAAKAEADQIKAELARERAARKHSLTDDDLALLDGVPADQFEARAAALAKRLGAAAKTPAGRSGNEVGGAKAEPSIDAQIADAQKAGNMPLVIALKQRKFHAA